MYKTYYPKASEVKRDWALVDASGQNLGRLATQIATLLLKFAGETRDKKSVCETDVVVINASAITVTGKKLDDKFYHRHSGYPGGLKSISLRNQLKKFPERVIRSAVWGMLPHNKMGRHLLKKLRIYSGAEHPHNVQNLKKIN